MAAVSEEDEAVLWVQALEAHKVLELYIRHVVVAEDRGSERWS